MLSNDFGQKILEKQIKHIGSSARYGKKPKTQSKRRIYPCPPYKVQTDVKMESLDIQIVLVNITYAMTKREGDKLYPVHLLPKKESIED